MQDGLLYPQVVELIYQAVLEPELWSNALAGILPNFRSQHVALFKMGEVPLFVHHGFTEDQLKVQFSPEAIRSWQSWRSALPLDQMFTNRHIVSDREWQRSETYNEFIRHSGVYHGALMNNESSVKFSFAICRPDVSNPYTEAELATLQSLNTHIANALRLHEKLNAATRQTKLLKTALDTLSEAAVIVNADGVVVLTNPRAQEILDRSDGLIDGTMGLRTQYRALTQNLLDAIHMVSSRCLTRNLHLSIPRLKPRLPLLLDIFSLSQLNADTGGAGEACALIFIKEPDAPFHVNRQALADTLRLTPREVDVAALLAEGMSVEKIGKKAEISVGTVRYHIKQIFQKTGVRSQAALVSFLYGFGSR